MKFEFKQGVPKECILWLWENIGEGNIAPAIIGSNIIREKQDSDDWYYERMEYEVSSADPKHVSGTRYVPTIFIEDEKKAVLFALRWL